MLKLKIGTTSMMSGKTWFICGYCNTKSIYFTLPAKKCENCNKALPDMEKLKRSIGHRMRFYIKEVEE